MKLEILLGKHLVVVLFSLLLKTSKLICLDIQDLLCSLLDTTMLNIVIQLYKVGSSIEGKKIKRTWKQEAQVLSVQSAKFI